MNKIFVASAIATVALAQSSQHESVHDQKVPACPQAPVLATHYPHPALGDVAPSAWQSPRQFI